MSLRRRTVSRTSGAESVVEWRAKHLRAAGLRGDAADAIAVDSRYDLHALLELVDRGCPAELAVRILAPLDRPGAAW